MNKVWFVFIQNHHLGPFHLKDIEKMLLEGKIDGKSMLWREGQSGWMPLAQIKELEMLLLPPLPPEIQTEETSPRLKLVAPVMDPTVTSNEDADHSESESVAKIHLPKRKVSEGQSSNNKGKWAIIGLIFFGCIMLWYFQGQQTNEEKAIPRDVLSFNSSLLQKAMGNLDPEVIDVKIVSSVDHRKIYLATNLNGNWAVSLKFKSIKGQLLNPALAPIHFTAKAHLSGRLVNFDKFHFSQGSELVPGRYDVQIKLRSLGIKSMLAQKLSFFSSLKSLESVHDFKDQVLLYGGDPKDFEMKLVEVNKEQREKIIRPIEERIEYLKTIIALGDVFQDLYFGLVSKKISPATLGQFDREYGQKVGAILLSMAQSQTDEHSVVTMMSKKSGELFAKYVVELKQLVKAKKTIESQLLKQQLSQALLLLKSELEREVQKSKQDLDQI